MVNELHLFAGAGGGILGGMLLGHTCVCAVEIEEYPRQVLLQRQRDDILPRFPIWDDVSTFDGRPWRGRVDVVAGGFPCQDISTAGTGAGIDGARSGLWKEMARIIGEIRPRFAFVENSPALTSRGLGVVLGDLAEMGYHARWGVLGAVDVGAPHKRERIWILATLSNAAMHGGRRESGELPEENEQQASERPKKRIRKSEHAGEGRTGDVAEALRNEPQGEREGGTASRQAGLCSGAWRNKEQDILADANQIGRNGRARLQWTRRRDESTDSGSMADASDEGDVRGDGCLGTIEEGNGLARGSAEDGSGEWWAAEPDVGRVAHGVAARVDRLKAIGNGQVPQVAALAWRLLGGPVT